MSYPLIEDLLAEIDALEAENNTLFRTLQARQIANKYATMRMRELQALLEVKELEESDDWKKLSSALPRKLRTGRRGRKDVKRRTRVSSEPRRHSIREYLELSDICPGSEGHEY